MGVVEGVEGREEGGRKWREGSGGGGREWWGGSGDAGPRCCSSLARVVALGGVGPPLLFVVGACGPSLPFVFGVHRCPVRDHYSWLGVRRRPWVVHCGLWMGVIVVCGELLWLWMGHHCGP
jgi:hypothetical protein